MCQAEAIMTIERRWKTTEELYHKYRSNTRETPIGLNSFRINLMKLAKRAEIKKRKILVPSETNTSKKKQCNQFRR